MTYDLRKPLPREEINILTRIETRYNYVLEYFPYFQYWQPAEKYKHLVKMSCPNNIVGYQQRAFESYWCMRRFIESGGIPGITVCAGQAPGLFTITNDYYYGENHPEYGGAYHPHIVHTAEAFPFLGESTFPVLSCLHGLEHLENTVFVLKEWIRIVQEGGILALILPDAEFVKHGDKGHKVGYSADEFRDLLYGFEDFVYVEEIDTLDNGFSFNVVLRKKSKEEQDAFINKAMEVLK
jgi:SAM-dependent methyltransferase